MQENEDFLLTILKDTGRTNLSDYFTNYLRDKEKKKVEESIPQSAMLP